MRSSLAALAAAFATACGGDRGGYVLLYEEPAEETRNIDIGAGIELNDGAGLAVEALVGGQWRLTTSCDAWRGLPPCVWDIVASIDPAKDLLVASSSLEEGDSVRQVDRGAVRILYITGVGPGAGDAGASGDAGGSSDAGASMDAGIEAGAEAGVRAGLSDLDEVVLNAPEGEPLRLDVVLDRGPDGRLFVSWTEGGAIRAGLQSNSVVFTPTPP